MRPSKLSRRDFLKLARDLLLAASALLGLGGLVRFLDTRTQPDPQTDFDAGPADAFADGSRTLFPQIPAVVIKQPQGFTALSLVCTHLGCTVSGKVDGFTCPCHGSQFDLQGRVVRRPASRPLAVLRIGITSDGRLHVYTD